MVKSRRKSLKTRSKRKSLKRLSAKSGKRFKKISIKRGSKFVSDPKIFINVLPNFVYLSTGQKRNGIWVFKIKRPPIVFFDKKQQLKISNKTIIFDRKADYNYVKKCLKK